MEFLQSIYQIQKKEVNSKHDISFVITQKYLIPEYHKIIIRYSKKKNVMNTYNTYHVKNACNNLCDLSI